MSEVLVPDETSSEATVLVVGDCPDKYALEDMSPFGGQVRAELFAQLGEAGIELSSCHFTNVCPYMPAGGEIDNFFLNKTEAKQHGLPEISGWYPDYHILEGLMRLEDCIRRVRPRLILCLGATALWAVTGETKLSRWRTHPFEHRSGARVLATYHPSAVLRQWEQRPIAVHDLRRAAGILRSPSDYAEKPFRALIRPTFVQTYDYLRQLLAAAERAPRYGEYLYVSVDIETRKPLITCIGLAADAGPECQYDAICIPFIDFRKSDWNYYSRDGEWRIVQLLRKLLTHPAVRIIGQNYIYDAQYISFWFGIPPTRVQYDTMVAHHTLFPQLPKALDFLSSLYLIHHRYWKDEGKDFDAEIHDMERHWLYNATDAQRTLEIAHEIRHTAKLMGKEQLVKEQMEFWHRIYKTTVKGIAVSEQTRSKLYSELFDLNPIFESFFAKALPPCAIPKLKTKTAKPWWRSPIQQQEIFYDKLGIKPVLKRTERGYRPTTDDNALEVIGTREILVRHITDMLSAYRSVGVLSNVLQTKTDYDGRMRCSFNPAATITFRLSSSENAFGFGTNMQNVSGGGKYDGKDSNQRLPIHIPWPNVRRLFSPDTNYTLCETDLERADAQVVAWDAEDEELKEVFRSGADVHTENAKAVYGERIVLQPNFKEVYRHRTKAGVHAVNYYVRARTLAKTLGTTVKEAEDFIARWLGAHPAIDRWHKRIQSQMDTNRTVTNAFGYSCTLLTRSETLLSEALAWIPQSTVALLINKIWNAIADDVEILLQVHDSLVFQTPTNQLKPILSSVYPKTRIAIPYPDPLYIPVGLKASPVSWGDCKDLKWGEL